MSRRAKCVNCGSFASEVVVVIHGGDYDGHIHEVIGLCYRHGAVNVCPADGEGWCWEEFFGWGDRD